MTGRRNGRRIARRALQAIALACAVAGLPGAACAAGGGQGGVTPERRLGAHLPEISPWTAPVYADFLKQAMPWTRAGSLDPLPPEALDAKGWPTVDARILFSVGTPGPRAVIVGRHRLSFTGTARVLVAEGGARIEHQRHDRKTNTTTADVVITTAGANYYLEFQESWRRGDHAPDAGGHRRGITDARLMAEGHAWPADLFRKEVVAMRQVFGVFQFEWPQGPGDGAFSANGTITGIMGSGDTTWSTRSRPGVLGYARKGMPWEDIVLFANTVGVDVWVHIPIGADDDYVRKAFQLLRYGSDGDQPYGSQVHDPATWSAGAAWYPGLLPGRRVHVEFSNELFTYYGYGDAQGRASLAAGDPWRLGTVALAGGSIGDRWGAAMAVRNALIAREVWGDAAMGTTVRIVYANQADWGGWARHAEGLAYVAKVFGPRSPHDVVGTFRNPRKPVSHYLSTLAGAFYLSAPGADGTPAATSVGDMGTFAKADGAGLLGQLKRSLSVPGGNRAWDSESSIYQQQDWGEAMAAANGLRLSAYETGTAVFKYGAVREAWSHPQMRTIYARLLSRFLALPHADVAMQSATVRGAQPPNELSMSYAAEDGFPWPMRGSPAPSQMWRAVMDVAGGR